jgi:hypothetical protein
MSKKETAISAALPYILLGGATFLGLRYLSQKTSPSNIAGGAIEYVREIVNTTTDSIKDKTNKIIDAGNENAVLKYITPDIQRPTEMTETQKTALEEYKKGNVTTKTVADPNSLYAKLFRKDSKPTKTPEKRISLTSLPSIPPSAATQFEQAMKIHSNPPSLPETKISLTSLPSIPASAAKHFEQAMKIHSNPPQPQITTKYPTLSVASGAKAVNASTAAATTVVSKYPTIKVKRRFSK